MDFFSVLGAWILVFFGVIGIFIFGGFLIFFVVLFLIKISSLKKLITGSLVFYSHSKQSHLQNHFDSPFMNKHVSYTSKKDLFTV